MSIDLRQTSKFGVLEISSLLKQEKSVLSSPARAVDAPKISSLAPVVVVKNEAIDIEQLILDELNRSDSISDSWEFALSIKQDHQAVVGAIKSLLPEAYIKDEMLTTSYYTLTDEAKDILVNGSPEYQVYKELHNAADHCLQLNELNTKLGDVAKIGLGKCLQNKWVKKEGEKIVIVAKNVSDEVVPILQKIATDGQVEEEEAKSLKKRKLITQVTRKSYRLTCGASYLPTRVKRVAELTKDMIGNDVSETNNPTHLVLVFILLIQFSFLFPLCKYIEYCARSHSLESAVIQVCQSQFHGR